MGRFTKLFFFAYRNSVGDVQIPDISYWQLFTNETNHEEKESMMAFCLWGLWLFNNLYMVIILLNFLISIVSEAYSEALDLHVQTTYQQKCELNYEYDAIK